MRNFYKVIAVVLATLMVTSLIAIPSVLAGDGLTNPELVPEVVIFGNGDVVYSFGGIVKDKKAAVKVLDSYLKPAHTIIANSFSYNLSGYKQLNFGNGYCYANFSSNLDFDLPRGFTTRVTVTQATSRVAWLGTSPQWNANSLTHSDTFTWNAIGSVSINTNGGGWSSSSHTALWSYTSLNAWDDNHTFGGLTGSGALTSISESSTGDFRFDSAHTSITPTAYNSMWV